MSGVSPPGRIKTALFRSFYEIVNFSELSENYKKLSDSVLEIREISIFTALSRTVFCENCVNSAVAFVKKLCASGLKKS